MSTWFHKVVELLTSSGALKGVPEGDVGSFYNCASTLISNQVRGRHQETSRVHTHVDQGTSRPFPGL